MYFSESGKIGAVCGLCNKPVLYPGCEETLENIPDDQTVGMEYDIEILGTNVNIRVGNEDENICRDCCATLASIAVTRWLSIQAEQKDSDS